MKMTANINKVTSQKNNNSLEVNDKREKLLTSKWKLKSIYETGLISDEAKYQNVDMVFSALHIYVMYGNRVEKYRYKFISSKSFIVPIEGVDVKCIIKELNDDRFVFHADFKGHYFILELEKE